MTFFLSAKSYVLGTVDLCSWLSKVLSLSSDTYIIDNYFLFSKNIMKAKSETLKLLFGILEDNFA